MKQHFWEKTNKNKLVSFSFDVKAHLWNSVTSVSIAGRGSKEISTLYSFAWCWPSTLWQSGHSFRQTVLELGLICLFI